MQNNSTGRSNTHHSIGNLFDKEDQQTIEQVLINMNEGTDKERVCDSQKLHATEIISRNVQPFS